MTSLFKSLLLAGVQYAVAEGLLRGQWAKGRFKNLAAGAAFLLAAGALAYLAFIFLLASLFFQLAAVESLVMPALITGGIALLVVILLVIEGVRRLRR